MKNKDNIFLLNQKTTKEIREVSWIYWMLLGIKINDKIIFNKNI